MTNTTTQLRWSLLHLLPMILIPVITHALNGFGINIAAGVALIAVIATIATGQSRLIIRKRVTSSRWMWQTACALGLAVAAGLVVMSTVDLAGYDALATLGGMTAAGLVLGVVQAPMFEGPKIQWILASIAGWLIASILFRTIITSLAAMSIGGIEPYGLVYNAGHNELLWTATGLALFGVVTLRLLAPR